MGTVNPSLTTETTMARRTSKQSQDEIIREQWNRWRILIRRADFQKALRQLQQYFQDRTDTQKMVREFQQKWNIYVGFAERLRNPATPRLSMRTVKDYEAFFSDNPIPAGVSAYDPYHNDDPPYPEQADHPDQALVLRIDLSYPLTDVMNVIEEIVRRSIARRNKNVPGPYLPANRTRRRTSVLTKQLEVFDRYMNGETTKQIALSLGKPLGSVRSQLKTVFELTKIVRQHGSDRLWSRSHLKQCARCMRRKELDEDCPIVAKRYRGEAEVFEHYEAKMKKGLPLRN